MINLKSIISSILILTASSTINASTINFSENFNSPTSGIDYVGYAAQHSFGGGTGLLTTDNGSQTGAFWNTTAYNFQSFSTQFDFIIGSSTQGVGSGADGLTFSVIDTASYNTNSAIGGGGGGLGYNGLNNSFSVEFDTYNNGSIDGYNANHVGINQNGSINSLARTNLPFSLETQNTNDWHTANISMDVRGLLSIAIDGTDYLSYSLSNFSNNVYFGFTGATGGAKDAHIIDNWSIEIQQVPEPSIIALFGLGLLGMGIVRRKKQAS